MSDKLDGNDGTVEAWHFLDEDRRLKYGDKRLVEPGVTLTVQGSPELFYWGLHASVRAIDAVVNAPGPIVSRVVVGGEIDYGGHKIAGTERTALWLADAREVLTEWANWCADYATQKTSGGNDSASAYARDSQCSCSKLSDSFDLYKVRKAVKYAKEALAVFSSSWEDDYNAADELFNAELERRLSLLAPQAPEASQENVEASLQA